jgi:hypothetical protein
MSQQDYAVVMQTLTGNLSEGTPPRAKRPVVSGNVEKAQTKKSNILQVPSSLDQMKPKSSTAMKTDSDCKRIVFQFKMDEIDMSLYSGETGLEVCKRIFINFYLF